MTGDQLIASVKRRASIPTAQATFNPQDILDTANEEMVSYLAPLISDIREEYFVVFEDLEFTPSTEGQQTYYRIPSRAFAQKLRAVKLLDTSIPPREVSIDRLPYDKHVDYKFGYYLAGPCIYLVGVDSAGGIRLAYEMRPSKITLLESAAKISSFTSTTITLASVPTGFTGTFFIDIVRGLSPYDCLDWNRKVSISGSVLTVQDALAWPAEMTANQDYITLQEQAPFIQAPDLCDSLLAQRVAVKLLEALGDTESLGAAAAVAGNIEGRVRSSLFNRVEGSSPQIIHVNPLWDTTNSTL